MPRKKAVPIEEPNPDLMPTAESAEGGAAAPASEDNAPIPEGIPGGKGAGGASGEAGDTVESPGTDGDGEAAPLPGIPAEDDAGADVPIGDGIPGEAFPEEGSPYEDGGAFPSADSSGPSEPPSDEAAEGADQEYASLLQEWGEAEHPESGEGGEEAPLILDPAPEEEPSSDGEAPVEPDPGPETEGPPEAERSRTRSRRRQPAEASAPAADPRRDRVLTIEARDEVHTPEEREAIIWHEIQNAHWTRRILTGTLDGVERMESGMTIAVVSYKGFRVAIPVKEMMLFSERVPSGAEFEAMMARMRGILTARLGSEVDFIVKGHENKTRSVVGSRRDAMLRKRQTFYLDKNELGEPLIHEGRIVQARVVAVAEKVIRVEVFGVECAIVARGLSRAWVGSASDDYCVGDRILVRVQKISGTNPEDLAVTVDLRSVTNTSSADELKKCAVQGRYAGKVTDIRGGVVFIRLNNGVNAIAHSCYDRRTPGRRDDVSFSVTRLDEERGVAVGIITRIIKQNL